MSVGIETAAGEMAVGKTPRSTATDLALMSAGIKTPAGGMAVGKTPAGGMAVGKTPAGGMAVGKTPCSGGSGERRDRDCGWRDGCRQDAAQ